MTSSVEEMRSKLGPCWFCGDKATCGFAVLHDEVGPGLYKTCDRCSDAFKAEPVEAVQDGETVLRDAAQQVLEAHGGAVTAVLHCPYCGRPGATIVRHMTSCDDCRRAATTLTHKIAAAHAALADLKQEWDRTHVTLYDEDGKEL